MCKRVDKIPILIQYIIITSIIIKGHGGFHQNLLEIDYIVVSNRGELYLSAAFNSIEYCFSYPKLSLVTGQRLHV